MSRDGKKKETRRSQQADSNLSLAFEGFSRSLDNHSKALDKFADQFNKTMNSFSDDLKSSTPGTGSKSESQLADASRVFERTSKSTEEGLNNLQKTGKTIETILSSIGSLIVGEIRTATSNVSNAYKSHLSSITAQMQLDHSQYASMFKEAQDTFKSFGEGQYDLRKQFSAVDFAESLESVLSTGLRGDEAQRLAYQNLITNKLLPAISTNTVAYRRMSKVFGEEFNKNTAAYASYTEAILGSEGISEGKYNAMMDTLYADMMYAAEGNVDKANEMQNVLTTILSHMESSLNMDGNAFVEMLYQGSTGQIGEDPISQYLFGIFDQEGLKEALSSPVKMAEVYEEYVKVLSQNAYDPNRMQSFSAATDMDQSQVKLASAYVLGGGVTDNLAEEILKIYNNFDLDSEYSKRLSALEAGEYQTKDDALTKVEENAMTAAAVVVSGIPRFEKQFDTIISILKSIASIWLFDKATSSSGLFGSSTPGGAGLGSVGDLADLDGANWAQVLTGSANATPAGLLVGAGSLLAGGAMAVSDGVSVGKENDSVWAGLVASVTGDSNIGLDEEEKLSKARESVDKGLVDSVSGVDWAKVGENALKGTLVGAGVGTAVGGWALGAGTAIGAAGGALAGAVTSVADQLIASAKYNKLAKVSSELVSTYQNLEDSQSRFNEIVDKESDVLNNLAVLNGEVAASDEEKLEAFEALKAEYPAELANIKTINEWDSKYNEILKEKVTLEKQIAGNEAISAAAEFGKLSNEVSDKFESIAGDKAISESVYNFAKEVGSEHAAETKGDLTSLLQKYADEAGVSLDTFVSMVNSATNGDLVQKTATGYASASIGTYVDPNTGLLINYDKTLGDNYSQLLKNYDESGYLKSANKEDVQSQLSEQMNEQWSNIQNMYSSLYETVSGFSETTEVVDQKGNKKTSTAFSMTDSQKKSHSQNLDIFEEMINNYNEMVARSGLNEKLTSDAFSSLSLIYEAAGRSVPKFKVGLDTVPYDDFLASLHAGEMVLTADDADKLRSAASRGSGLSRVLSIVESLSKFQSTGSELPPDSRDDESVLNGLLSAPLEVKGVDSILDEIKRHVRITPEADDTKTFNFEEPLSGLKTSFADLVKVVSDKISSLPTSGTSDTYLGDFDKYLDRLDSQTIPVDSEGIESALKEHVGSLNRQSVSIDTEKLDGLLKSYLNRLDSQSVSVDTDELDSLFKRRAEDFDNQTVSVETGELDALLKNHYKNLSSQTVSVDPERLDSLIKDHLDSLSHSEVSVNTDELGSLLKKQVSELGSQTVSVETEKLDTVFRDNAEVLSRQTIPLDTEEVRSLLRDYKEVTSSQSVDLETGSLETILRNHTEGLNDLTVSVDTDRLQAPLKEYADNLSNQTISVETEDFDLVLKNFAESSSLSGREDDLQIREFESLVRSYVEDLSRQSVPINTEELQKLVKGHTESLGSQIVSLDTDNFETLVKDFTENVNGQTVSIETEGLDLLVKDRLESLRQTAVTEFEEFRSFTRDRLELSKSRQDGSATVIGLENSISSLQEEVVKASKVSEETIISDLTRDIEKLISITTESQATKASNYTTESSETLVTTRVVEAITLQTDTLVGAISSIYDLLVQTLAPSRSVNPSNTAIFPRITEI